jgi:hypothetical protein
MAGVATTTPEPSGPSAVGGSIVSRAAGKP